MNNKLLIFGLCCSFYLMGMSFVVAAKTDNAVLRVHFRDVVAQAKALAQRPFQDPAKDLPDVVKKMGYDQWRDIRFKPARQPLGGTAFFRSVFPSGFSLSASRDYSLCRSARGRISFLFLRICSNMAIMASKGICPKIMVLPAFGSIIRLTPPNMPMSLWHF